MATSRGEAAAGVGGCAGVGCRAHAGARTGAVWEFRTFWGQGFRTRVGWCKEAFIGTKRSAVTGVTSMVPRA